MMIILICLPIVLIVVRVLAGRRIKKTTDIERYIYQQMLRKGGEDDL